MEFEEQAGKKKEKKGQSDSPHAQVQLRVIASGILEGPQGRLGCAIMKFESYASRDQRRPSQQGPRL